MDNIQKRLGYCIHALRNTAKKDQRYTLAKRVLFGDAYVDTSSDSGRDEVAKFLFLVLEHRQKHGKYGIDHQRHYYYKAKNGRLAYVSRDKADALIRRKKIVDFEASEEIPSGILVRHRRVLNDLERDGRRIDGKIKLVLEHYFDGQKPCKMIIDTNFELAYDPIYHGYMSTDGDLANEESCMSGRGCAAQEFYGGIDGCKVARFETEDGEQVGRCIVYEWGEKRHFIRIYGRGAYHRTMLNLVRDSLKPGDLFGRSERLNGMCLSTNWTSDTPNMYLDGNEYGISFDGDNWTVKADCYDYDGKSTSDDSIGEVYDECDYYTCFSCGRRVHDDDVYWGGDDTAFCCASCAREAGWRSCDRCGQMFNEDDSGCVISGDNEWCCEACANRDGYYKCDECDEYVDKDDLYTTDDGETTMCRNCIEKSDEWTIDDDSYLVKVEKNNEEDNND